MEHWQTEKQWIKNETTRITLSFCKTILLLQRYATHQSSMPRPTYSSSTHVKMEFGWYNQAAKVFKGKLSTLP